MQTIVPAQSIGGWCYVRLTDGGNILTPSLIATLELITNDLNDHITNNTPIFLDGIGDAGTYDENEEEECEEEDVYVHKIVEKEFYIKQIDFTQDLCGFFLSNKVLDDL